MQNKRKFIFGDYDTAIDGLWTLSAWSLGEAKPLENLVDIPGRIDGPIDLTEAGTGDVMYSTRALSVTLESSEGTRADREERIRRMVNTLHGRRAKIWTPDDPEHYLSGRLTIKKNYSDLAHASVTITSTCAPWRYDNEETVVTVELADESQEVELQNTRRPVFPELRVQGELTMVDKDTTYKLSEGIYLLPALELKSGETRVLEVSGTGSISFSYRKAVL